MKTRYTFLSLVLLVSAAVGLLAQPGPSPNGPTVTDSDELRFISTPSPTARVNMPYVYTAKAVSRDTTAVIWSSGRYMNLMSMTPAFLPFPIDSATGVVNWTPTIIGWYAIVITARSNKGDHESQEFTVLVSGGSGTIQGRVTDTTVAHKGIPDIIVRAFRTDITPMSGMDDHDGGFFTYSARTDSDGYYTINSVQPGSYKLRAVSSTPDFLSQWYDGKTDAASANIVTVADSSETTVDFVLRGRLMKVTVSGHVSDTTGAAFQLPCRVFFVRAGFVLNSNMNLDDFRDSFDDDHDGDFRLDGTSRNVFSASVDSTGNYKLRIPTGGYIAFARSKGFVTSYFQNQTDFTAANVLVLQADSGNINFTMVPLPPVALGSIGGRVSDSSNGIGVRARVIAFRDHWRDRDDYHVARTYTTDTDSTGGYLFDDLLPGKYIVFAIPVGKYAPAYYTTDTASTRWKRATVLTINGNSLTGINIYVRPLPATLQGYTGVKGSVTAGNQGAVAGAIVYAALNGQVSGYGLVGNDGNYAINGLAPGTYSVSVDRPGFDEPSSQSANISYANTTSGGGLVNSSVPVIQTVNFSVSGTATGVNPISGVILSYTLGQNYPNPFNPSTKITFALPQAGKATLKVFNILGQEVASLVDGYQDAGSHQIVFDASRLASGVYFYQLRSGSFEQSKKMVLLK